MSSFLKVLEEFGVLGGLVGMQLTYAVSGILSSYVMSIGLNPLFLIIIGNLTTSFLFFPLSICFERNQWPRKISLKLLCQFLLISFAGVALCQSLMIYGLKKTSPALASVMPNLSPGFIFIIAWLLRFERVDMKCLYSRVKILGTILCIVGAILMSFMHSNTAKPLSSSKAQDQERIIGTICLLAGVIVLSFNIILQAATLGDFPAPISLNAITAFMGAIFTGVLQLITQHRLEFRSNLVSAGNLIWFLLLGSMVSGACTSFQTWAIKKKGPVFISTLSPIGTVFSIILSSLALGYSVTSLSLFGIFLIFAGLYSVLWAKGKEYLIFEEENEESPKICDTRTKLLT